MFNFFKIKFQNGVLPDNRLPEEKALDYKQQEIVTAPAPVEWKHKTTFRTFPTRKQGASGSCWEQATEKERGIMAYLKYGKFIVFSSFPYKFRENTANSGSNKLDRIMYANMGSVEESLIPSQSMSDSQIQKIEVSDYYKDLAKVTGCKTVDIPIDINTIASTIEVTGKGVNICLRFGPGEWFYQLVAKILGINIPWGHSVVAVDYYLNSKNEKCLRIEDSACEDGFPQREVNEQFLLNRCFDCSYLVNFKTYIEKPDKPTFDGSIKSLQDCLKYEGFFPATQQSTGFFGPITKTALKTFQKKYNIIVTGELDANTTKKIHELYN